MENPIKYIELNYYCHQEFTTPEQVIAKHQPSNLFTRCLNKHAEVVFIKHLSHEGATISQDLRYLFFRRSNSFWQIPFGTHRAIKKEKPDVVLVHGFIFPLQVMALRMALGKHCKIIQQHQAEPPFKRKKIFQQINDRCVDAYLFTSRDMASEWIKAKVIKDPLKCFELPCASTLFAQKDKAQCRQQLHMNEGMNFLWVGRLNENKDPVTVLRGFEQYVHINPAATLYMIYQEDDILDKVRDMVRFSFLLRERVVLVGKIPYPDLEAWYSAADYFVSGSHREGGSYALMEAMACGCVPIVTSIPAALQMTAGGTIGYHYPAGNANELFRVLFQLNKEKQPGLSEAAKDHFEKELSPGAIVRKFLAIYSKLREGDSR
jgi:glycosyltransferase involved in cell wall biosynthesis